MKPRLFILALLSFLSSLFCAHSADSITVTTPQQYQDFLSQFVSNNALDISSYGDISLSGSLSPAMGSLFYLRGQDGQCLINIQNSGNLFFQGDGSYRAIDTWNNGYCDQQIVFSNVGQVVFSGFSGASGGAILAQLGGVVFSQVKSILFENNTATGSGGRGGAMHLAVNSKDVPGKLDIVDLAGGFIARNNVAGNIGGAIANTSGGLNFERTGNILFELNKSLSGGGGAINSWGQANYISFQDTKGISFLNNESGTHGGAIAIEVALVARPEALLFSRTGNILFQGNKAGNGYGGAIFAMSYDRNQQADIVFFNTGKLEFLNNTSTHYGGAIYAGSYNEALPVGLHITDAVSVKFEGNRASKGASAIYCTNLIISDCGDVSFLNNQTEAIGTSAVYLNMTGMGNNILSADKGNILFQGNFSKNSNPGDFYALIAFGRNGSTDLNIRAAEGRKVSFYDPVYIGRSSTMIESDLLLWELNKGEGYTGTIFFSGEDFQEKGWTESGVSDGSITFYQGTLALEKKALLSANEFTQKGGILDMTDAKIEASVIQMKQSSTLKPGEQAWLITKNTDMSQGLAFDLGYYLTPDTVLPLDGLQIVSSTLTLGNGLSIADKGAKLEYYENARWRQKQTFTLADVTQVETVTGDFSGIISQLAGSDIVKGFGYNGTWSYENKDGQLLAIWSPNATPNPDPDPTPNPEPDKSVHPELAGNLTLNSLWSTVSNMKAFSRSALGQVGLTRFLLPKNTNYWALGLGDFSSHRNAGSIDGYDYHGFGYAVGADTKLSDNLITGLAFGNLYGKNKSQNYNVHIDQASYISLAYGSWFKELDKSNSLVLNGTASYGLTANKMDIRYSDGDRSRGKWDNNALRLTLKGEWNHALNGQWTLTPFVGVEYDNARQKSFTETGDKSRRFERASLRNLALPVGAGISHTTSYSNGMKWLNSVALSYVPDVYRKNPESETLRTTNGFTWTAEGLRPVRNAGRVEFSTRLIVNETWSLFGGYMLEGRKDALYHNANLGVSASF